MAKGKKLTVEDWRLELEHAFKYRRLYGGEERWGDSEAIFYNVHDSQLRQGPNLIFSVGDTLLSDLIVPRPFVSVSPTSIESVQGAPVLQAVDNKLIKDMKMNREVEMTSLHSYLWGPGILKFGYDSEWGWADSGITQGEDVGGLGDDLGFSTSRFSKKGERIEFNSVKPGMPWCRAVLPHDFLVPWGTPPQLDKAPWAAHRVVRHLDDVKADVKYPYTKGLKANMSIDDFITSYQRPGSKPRSSWQIKKPSGGGDGQEYVEMWEIHDRRSGRVMVYAEGHPRFLRDDVDLLQIGGSLPFVGMAFTPRSRTFWTTSYSDYLLSAQAELTDISVQSTKHRRLSVLKMLIQGGVFSEPELDRLLSSDVGAVAQAVAGADLDKAVKLLTPQPNLSLRVEGEEVRRDARELVGVSRNNMGESDGKTHITATQTLQVEAGGDKRRGRLGNQVASLYTDGLNIVNGIIQEHWKLPQVITVVGQDGREQWVKFDGTQLKGNFDYNVTFMDESQRAQIENNALQMYLTLSQDPSVDKAALRSYLTTQINRPEFSRIFGGAEPLPPQQPAPTGGQTNATV